MYLQRCTAMDWPRCTATYRQRCTATDWQRRMAMCLDHPHGLPPLMSSSLPRLRLIQRLAAKIRAQHRGSDWCIGPTLKTEDAATYWK